MARKQGAILDLDGTVYREDRLLPGVDKGIDRLRSAGLELLFLTNSAVDSPEAIREKLSGFGIRVDADQILTSGEITADYLEESHPDSTPLVIGEETIRDAFKKGGLLRLTIPPRPIFSSFPWTETSITGNSLRRFNRSTRRLCSCPRTPIESDREETVHFRVPER